MPFVPSNTQLLDNLIVKHGARLRRKRTFKGAAVIDRGKNTRFDCVVKNISESGAKLQFGAAMVLPRKFLLRFDSEGLEVDCEIVWNSGLEMGVRFLCELRPLARVQRLFPTRA